MFNYIKYIMLISFFMISAAGSSHAVVHLVNGSANGLGDQTNPFTQGFIQLPGGPSQSFELLVCTTTTLGGNSFLQPNPDSLELIDTGNCGTPEIPLGTCVTGIWGHDPLSTSTRDGLCSWTDPTTVYAAGAFRWSGVDNIDPIIDIACQTGFGSIGTAPSINVDEGSGIVRVFTFGVNFTQGMVNANEIVEGSITVLSISDNPGNFQAVFLKEFAGLAETSGPTGDFSLSLPEEIGEPDAIAPWRACTIGLRAAATDIPTMSEWGLGIFIALVGAASVLALRRRARTA